MRNRSTPGMAGLKAEYLKTPFILFYFWLCGMWDLSSLTMDGLVTPALEAERPNHSNTGEIFQNA